MSCSLLLALGAPRPVSSLASSASPFGGETGISLRGRCSSGTSTLAEGSSDSVDMVAGSELSVEQIQRLDGG